MVFDAPSRQECTAERATSNTPMQALTLLNDPTYVEAARVFASRIVREGGESVADRINWAYQWALFSSTAAEGAGDYDKSSMKSTKPSTLPISMLLAR